MELGKSEIDWGEFPRLKVCKMEWAQRKRDEKYKKETVEKKRGKRKEKGERNKKKKKGRFSRSGFEWSLSFERDSLKF